MDWMDVCVRVKGEVSKNEQLSTALSQPLLVLGNPASQLQVYQHSYKFIES